jgi:hypothetical protein
VTYIRGGDAVLTVQWLDVPGGSPVNVTGVGIEITYVATAAVVVTGGSVQALGTGLNAYTWSIPADASVGSYLVEWSGVDPQGDDVVASELIDVIASSTGYTGACGTWDPIWGSCAVDLSPSALAVTGYALQAATDVLWSLTGQRFGLCTTTLRPCRRSCYGEDWWAQSGWWEYGRYPNPTWIRGTWYNLGCGGCGDTCSCVDLEETVLPAPVHAILEVKVDGTALEPSDYSLQDYRKLVRVDGERWPDCNDLTLADTEAGTWSITLQVGEEVPVLGRMALGELACEFARGLAGEACRLPAGVQQVTRQGVSMTFNELSKIFDAGLVGLPLGDQFVHTYNPGRLRSRARVYDLDGPKFRVVS